MSCPKCHGTGWILKEEKGRVIAVRCNHLEEERSASLLESSGIPQKYRQCNFENFLVSSQNQSQVMAKKIVKNYAEKFPAVNEGLLIMGPAGVGKTHLASALCLELIKKGITCKFVDFRELLHNFWDLQEVPEEREAMFQTLVQVPLLVLDDFGSRRMNQWEEDFIYRLINKRYEEEMPLVLTTSFMDEPVGKEESLEERIGYRLRSRLYEMCRTILIFGEDYRKKYKNRDFVNFSPEAKGG